MLSRARARYRLHRRTLGVLLGLVFVQALLTAATYVVDAYARDARATPDRCAREALSAATFATHAHRQRDSVLAHELELMRGDLATCRASRSTVPSAEEQRRIDEAEAGQTVANAALARRRRGSR